MKINRMLYIFWGIVLLFFSSCKVNPSYNDVALFHKAIDDHEVKKVREYIRRFKHIANFELNYLGVSSTNPALESVIEDDYELLQIVVSNGSAVNYQDVEFGNFPLQMAVKNNNMQMVQYLLKKGANPLLVDKNGLSVLHAIAWRTRNLEMAKLFQKHIINLVNSQDIKGETPFYQSLIEGDIGNGKIVQPNHDLVFFLLDNGADLKYTFSKQYDVYQPLIERKENEYLRKIFSYYDGEIPVSAYDNMDYVQLGIFCRNPEIVSLFLPKVKKNNPDTWGRTALHLAAYMDDPELIRLLVTNGYDNKIIDDGGNTAYSIYVSNHQNPRKEIIDLLKP